MLRHREIPFDAVDRKVMCFGHVIDLSSGRVTRSADTTGDNDRDESDESDNDTAAPSPIARARDVVRVIRGSGMRREAFDEVVANGNAKGWFKEGRPPVTITIKPLQLLRDVRTRWDSVYLMLNRLREMRPVFLYYCRIWFMLNQYLTGCGLLPCSSQQQ
jgi:hypothetical protein